MQTALKHRVEHGTPDRQHKLMCSNTLHVIVFSDNEVYIGEARWPLKLLTKSSALARPAPQAHRPTASQMKRRRVMPRSVTAATVACDRILEAARRALGRINDRRFGAGLRSLADLCRR